MVVTHNGKIRKLFRALHGVAIGTLIFIAAVFVLATIDYQVDKLVVQNKVVDAIRNSAIQYPGKEDINDKRGINTFTDCIVLQSTILDHGRLWSDMFDTLGDKIGPHTCDRLVDSGGYIAVPYADLYSYHRYWWGSAVIAKIALGITGISIRGYQSLMMMLSWLSLITLTASFYLSYGRVSVVFLPLFISIGLGYGLLIMGQSIAGAPEFIVGLLLLSAYCVGKVQQFSLRARAIFYSFLGSVCVYFDLLDGTVVLIAILLCCELSAPYAARLLNPNNAQAAYSDAALAREIVINCSLVVIGGGIAIVVRILGYSIVSHANVLQVATDWMSNLSFRFSGSLYERGLDERPSLYHLLGALIRNRQVPFHGILGRWTVDSFYVLGFAAWAIAMRLCWKLHVRGVSPVTVAVGFVIAAALVPAWFIVFENHTTIHAWMTGRLVTPFCGLGMSLAVLAGWALASAQIQSTDSAHLLESHRAGGIEPIQAETSD